MNSFENNQLIAEFLGFQSTDIGWYDAEETLSEIEKYGNTFDNYDLRFDFDWNWLMVVVEKIFAVEEFIKDDLIFKLNDSLLEANKESLYRCSAECIKNYNQTN